MNEDRQELTLQEQKHLVAVDSMDEVIRLFGVFDENLKVIEEETGAVIKAGADCIDITGVRPRLYYGTRLFLYHLEVLIEHAEKPYDLIHTVHGYGMLLLL